MPAASIARTLNLCLPFFRCLSFFGDSQGSKGLLSSLHRKLEPGSEETNLNSTLRLRVLLGGRFVIVVSGGTGGGKGRASTATPLGTPTPIMASMKGMKKSAVPSRLVRPIVFVSAFAE